MMKTAEMLMSAVLTIGLKSFRWIPTKIQFAILIVGRSGQGKTTCMYNLIADKRFYGGFFDDMYLCSSTADVDDILNGLKIKDTHKFTDLKQAISALKLVQDAQKRDIAKNGPDKVKQLAIILDDCIGDIKFMNSASFRDSFIAPRHVNNTTFLSTQHLRRVPKIARMQAAMVIIFPCSLSEMDTVCEEYCPPGLHKLQFHKMLMDAWDEPFSFISIHNKQPMEKRFRKGIAKIFDLDHYRSLSLKELRSRKAPEHSCSAEGSAQASPFKKNA
jgi:hypothetical protein